MERIKLAVEKARHSRQLTQAHTTSMPKKLDGGLDGYQQTKKFHVDKTVYLQNRIIAGVDDKAARAAYKILRTQVLQRMSSQNWNSLAITSPGVGEGKTLTAINLAISLAREVNHTVLLVDMDLSRPSIARYFNYEPQTGIDDYLFNGVALNDILISPEIERLVILPVRKPIADSSDILLSPQLVNLATELNKRYENRIILYDMPPLLYADDVLAFMPYVDASLIVVEEGKTQQDELVRAVNLLKTHNIIGTVLNKTPYIQDNHYL